MRLATLFLTALSIVFPATADENVPPVSVGDPAPDVQLPDPNSGDDAPGHIALSSLRGANVLLAFYPKAFTPGCTAQLCGYRDDFAQFEAMNTTVIAISGDDQEASDRFKKEYALPFRVVGDPSAQLMKAFGIPVREMGGVVLAKRAVVLIDAGGFVRYIDPAYDINAGKEPLIAAIKALQEPESPEEGEDSSH